MADFVNTIDSLGEDNALNSLIDRTITEFKDNNITTVGKNAFRGCTALTTIDLPNVTTVGSTAFAECSSLTEVNLPLLTYLYEQTFFQCTSLKKITLPSVTGNNYQAFNSCDSLKYVDMASESFNGLGDPNIFGGKAKLETLIIRSRTLCAFTDNVFKMIDCRFVYVPATLIESYKTYSIFAPYAYRFRALEDYTVDGTVTGEFDEAKANKKPLDVITDKYEVTLGNKAESYCSWCYATFTLKNIRLTAGSILNVTCADGYSIYPYAINLTTTQADGGTMWYGNMRCCITLDNGKSQTSGFNQITSKVWETGSVNVLENTLDVDALNFSHIGFVVKKNDGTYITPSEAEAAITFSVQS